MFKIDLYKVWIAVLGVSIAFFIGGCAQQIQNVNPARNSSALGGDGVEPTITQEQYRQGLRRAKGLLLNNSFLTPSETSVSSKAAFEQVISNYLDNPESSAAIISFFKKLFQMEGTQKISEFTIADGSPDDNIYLNMNEPSNLAGYLFANEEDFRLMLTADFCVANDLTVRECLSQGRLTRNSSTNNRAQWFSMTLPTTVRAGALTTQAFLNKFQGALNFRLPSKAREYFLCAIYPDDEERDGWTRQNDLLHPKYHTQAGGDLDCQSCHSTLDKVRAYFTGIGSFGELQMGQQVARLSDQVSALVEARTINMVEEVTLSSADYQATYNRSPTATFESTPATYHGVAVESLNLNPGRLNNPSYANLKQYGQILAANSKFKSCTAQRFFNLAMGVDQFYLNRVPERLRPKLEANLETNAFNIKQLLLEIFTSVEFLNR